MEIALLSELDLIINLHEFLVPNIFNVSNSNIRIFLINNNSYFSSFIAFINAFLNSNKSKNSNPLLDYDSIKISESIKIEPEKNNQNEKIDKNNDKNKNLPKLDDTLSAHLNKLKIDNDTSEQPANNGEDKAGEIDFNLLDASNRFMLSGTNTTKFQIKPFNFSEVFPAAFLTEL